MRIDGEGWGSIEDWGFRYRILFKFKLSHDWMESGGSAVYNSLKKSIRLYHISFHPENGYLRKA